MSPKTRFVYDTFPQRETCSYQSSDPNSDKSEKFICVPIYGIKGSKNKTKMKLGHNIENGEIILDEFRCAIQLKILIQGMLYVSSEALYFHSYFNDSLIFFGKHTKMKVPLTDIKTIQKAKNAKIFDNSIKIRLSNE